MVRLGQQWQCYVCKKWYLSPEEKDLCMEIHGQYKVKREDGGYDWFPRKASNTS